jgi:hypothetical protein
MGTGQIYEILRMVRKHLTQVQRPVKLIDAELDRLVRVLAAVEVPPVPRRQEPPRRRPRRGADDDDHRPRP